MRSVNEVRLIGNVGKRPEVRGAGAGETLCATFQIACEERFEQDGKERIVTKWIPLKAWRRTAEVVRDYVDRGSRVWIAGKLNPFAFERNGETVYGMEVTVLEVVLLDRKLDAGANQRAG
jgi:single-strand DNA-binding protein